MEEIVVDAMELLERSEKLSLHQLLEAPEQVRDERADRRGGCRERKALMQSEEAEGREEQRAVDGEQQHEPLHLVPALGPLARALIAVRKEIREVVRRPADTERQHGITRARGERDADCGVSDEIHRTVLS